MLLYLHGFRSSPRSRKAQLLGRYMAERGLSDALWCEQLSHAPDQAVQQIDAVIRDQLSRGNRPTLVGSSLGGLYATVLSQAQGLRAVLINPAVMAALTLESYIGPQVRYHGGGSFELTREHIEQLRRLDAQPITRPELFWLMVETGDEVLDYHVAIEHYRHARQTVIQGGDHGFQHFPALLDDIRVFAGMRPAGA